jgi:epoxide hydrolase-like protein
LDETHPEVERWRATVEQAAALPVPKGQRSVEDDARTVISEPRPSLRIEPFSIWVEEEVLSDLRTRIRNTRWPDQVPGVAWEQGPELEYLRQVLAYWADEFDWRAQERRLNSFDQFRTELDAISIPFVHERAPGGGGNPLILTHGWPSTFVELLPLVPFLIDPEAHGIDGPAFDVVIPSLPGYGFSERPARTGVTTRYTAGLWHRLLRGLGYERYRAQGGDLGAGESPRSWPSMTRTRWSGSI